MKAVIESSEMTRGNQCNVLGMTQCPKLESPTCDIFNVDFRCSPGFLLIGNCFNAYLLKTMGNLLPLLTMKVPPTYPKQAKTKNKNNRKPLERAEKQKVVGGILVNQCFVTDFNPNGVCVMDKPFSQPTFCERAYHFSKPKCIYQTFPPQISSHGIHLEYMPC